ncbi:type I polyketide synthase [Gloeothece verrucosa]|uniref:Beta-ketoacyl synthase n=1 Tax=Gloeothece verrucosa (strain PCC 7822) TaxID=497965 RepID=E0UL65_GLOV7|nr:type I polyketide synthase [Gloeothece verrucosa]ADN17695.1 Beta-ketoacyl synthase [Gloeothece verrucosa PCC 7822]
MAINPLSEQNSSKAQPIAVIGLGCHYPGASELLQLWENIISRRCQFREFPDERLPLSEYYDPNPTTADKTYGNRGAFIDGFQFDPVKRRIPKSALDSTDIVHWLALEVAIKAVENAGYQRETVSNSRSGVILGNTLTGEHTRSHVMRLRWPFVRKALREAAKVKGMSPHLTEELVEIMEKFYKSVFPPITEDSLAGGLSNTIAGRICNFFNFDGGGYTVDGACSSSLIAIATAANALHQGDLDLALAGGVDISLDTFELIGFAKTGALTSKDMTVYDRRASGFIPGEGCGFVVLKRLEDARRDGNYIYAVINGWGISSDGKGGITAPSKIGQSKALLQAYKKAAYSPQTLHFIEGHGTGTPVGDRTEIEGIALAMNHYGDTPPRTCGMTSFKSLVGHTKAAAGVGGFIKAVMAVNQRVVPPTVGCSEPHAVFEQTAQALYPIVQGQIYPPTETLRAGVSAMGFGGINCHVTLSSGDAPATALKPAIPERALLVSNQDTELFILTASSISHLLQQIPTLIKKVQGMSLAELPDLAAQLSQQIQTHYPLRAAIVAGTPLNLKESLQELEQMLRDNPPAPSQVQLSAQKHIWVAHQVQRTRVAFLFPGQGSQRLNMARRIVERYTWAQDFLRQADQWLQEEGFEPISPIIYRPLDRAIDQQQVKQWFNRLTSHAPTTICFISLLWQKYLNRLGIQPVAVAGHSLGELTAFAASGAYDEKTLLLFAALRGRVMNQPSGKVGTMASLSCSRLKAEELIRGISGYVVIANLNSPQQTVISGEIESVQAVIQRAVAQDIQARQLPVSNGFHSLLVSEAANILKKSAPIPAELSNVRVLLYTSKTGQQVLPGINLKEHFADQAVAQVDFISLVQSLATQCDLMLEVGPGQVLSNLAAQISEYPLCLPLESKPESSRDFNIAMAALFIQGGQINWQNFYENRLIRSFTPADELMFIDNPCERPFAVHPEELEALSVTPAPSENLEEIERKVAQLSEDEVTQVLGNYFAQRSSFLAELIQADLQNFPLMNHH